MTLLAPVATPPWHSPALPRRFSCQITESHAGRRPVELPAQLIEEKLTAQLSQMISRDCMQYTVGEYSTEHRLDVYVLTPDQLERLIQQRAERLLATHPGVYFDASQGVF